MSLLTVSVGLYHNTNNDKYYLQSITRNAKHHFFFEVTKECAEHISQKNKLEICVETEITENWGAIQTLQRPSLIYKDCGTEETEDQILLTASMGLCELPEYKGTFAQIIMADTWQFLFFKVDEKMADTIGVRTRLRTYEVVPDMELVMVS